MSEDRGPAHCPQCAVVEPVGGFDRDDPPGTDSIARFRCLDCQATFAWRCYAADPECAHGPFRYEGSRFVFYFGQGTRREASRPSRPDDADPAAAESEHGRYRADLDIASYRALRRFLDATSDALVDTAEAEAIQSRLEAANGDIEWPCEIVFEFDRETWAAYSATHPDEATVLEPHLVLTTG